MAAITCGTERKRQRREVLERSQKERAELVGRARATARRAPWGKRTAKRKRLEKGARETAWTKRRARLAGADESCNVARAQLASDVAEQRKRRSLASPAKKRAGRRGAERLAELAEENARDVERTLEHDPTTADVAGYAAREFQRRPQRWLREAKTKKAYPWELYANHVREHLSETRERMHREAGRRTRELEDREEEERLRELGEDYDDAERAALVDDEALDPSGISFGD
ncbi:MAG: hypothetical protein HOV80_22090 [Polyangiaceae bacterium]|nr:hypothetical protein [Polyangiaceae bacterium]